MIQMLCLDFMKAVYGSRSHAYSCVCVYMSEKGRREKESYGGRERETEGGRIILLSSFVL